MDHQTILDETTWVCGSVVEGLLAKTGVHPSEASTCPGDRCHRKGGKRSRTCESVAKAMVPTEISITFGGRKRR